MLAAGTQRIARFLASVFFPRATWEARFLHKRQVVRCGPILNHSFVLVHFITAFRSWVALRFRGMPACQHWLLVRPRQLLFRSNSTTVFLLNLSPIGFWEAGRHAGRERASSLDGHFSDVFGERWRLVVLIPGGLCGEVIDGLLSGCVISGRKHYSAFPFRIASTCQLKYTSNPGLNSPGMVSDNSTST